MHLFFSGLRRINLYLFTAVFASLIAGRFAYLALLQVGEIQEFRDHFRYYPVFYLFIFVVGFVTISLLYLYVFSRLSKVTFEIAARKDLAVNSLFLLLLPYVFAFRYFFNLFGFGLFYFIVGSVVAVRLYLLINSVWRNRPRGERFHYEFFILFFLIGIALRLFLLLTSSRVVDSDEAIWGLMARHIILLGEHPTLFYGQPYMGSFSAYLAAVLFLLFGASSVVLKLVPLGYSLIFLLTTYLLIKETFSAKAALVGFFLVAVGPAFLIFHNVTQWGYMEAITLGNIVLLLVIRIPKQPPAGKKLLVLYGLLGLAMGIGFWLSVFMTAYIVTVVIFLLAKERLSFFGVKFVVLLGFFLIGLVPLIVFNLHNNFATWEFLVRSGGEAAPVAQRLQWMMISGKALLGNALPGILGIKGRPAYVTFPLYFLYACLAALAIGLSKRHPQSSVSAFAMNRKVPGVLYVLALLTIGSFLLSKVAAIYQIPRYLIPLYSVLPALVGAALAYLIDRWRAVGLFLLAIILTANLGGILGASQVAPPGVFSLTRSLERVGAKYVLANYWIAYQLTFVSKEKVISASHSGDWSHRYPEYNNQFDHASPAEQALIFPLKSRDITAVKERFRRSGITYSQISSGSYIILYGFSRGVSGEKLPAFEVGSDPRLQLGN